MAIPLVLVPFAFAPEVIAFLKAAAFVTSAGVAAYGVHEGINAYNESEKDTQAVPVPCANCKKPECEPQFVPHAGGDKIHDLCADKIPPNVRPGFDALVNGKRFDALDYSNNLWEVKTGAWATYSVFLKAIELNKFKQEGLDDLSKATACGFGFIFGVADLDLAMALRGAGAGFVVHMAECQRL